MANEEHLARLKQGVEAWNAWREEKYKEAEARLKRSKNRVTTQDQWRKKNSDLWPDLREADLRAGQIFARQTSSKRISTARISVRPTSRTQYSVGRI